jgi:hypothetical protein
MGKTDWNDNVAPVLIKHASLCQWGFNRARRFQYVSGNARMFGRPPEELLHQHVSAIDDPHRSWEARLDRIFSGISPHDTAGPTAEQHVIFHVPVHTTDGGVAYAAGFSFPAGDPPPVMQELGLAALAILQVLQAERMRTKRFLHDVVAQHLSSMGLQFEVLRLELGAHQVQTPSGSAEIQQALEEALAEVRAFSAGQDLETA